MASLSNVWKNRHLSLPTKIRVYQALVTSVLLYAAETWTVLAPDLKTLEAFHMKMSETDIASQLAAVRS